MRSGAQLDVPALGGKRRKREPERIGAVLVDHHERVDDIALGLAHLLAFGVAHERVDVHVPERDLVHEVEPHHDHARHPEKDDVEAR